MDTQLELLTEKWDGILQTIRQENDLSPVSFKTWLLPLKIFRIENHVLKITAPFEQAATYVENKFKTFLYVAACRRSRALRRGGRRSTATPAAGPRRGPPSARGRRRAAWRSHRLLADRPRRSTAIPGSRTAKSRAFPRRAARPYPAARPWS